MIRITVLAAALYLGGCVPLATVQTAAAVCDLAVKAACIINEAREGPK